MSCWVRTLPGGSRVRSWWRWTSRPSSSKASRTARSRARSFTSYSRAAWREPASSSRASPSSAPGTSSKRSTVSTRRGMRRSASRPATARRLSSQKWTLAGASSCSRHCSGVRTYTATRPSSPAWRRAASRAVLSVTRRSRRNQWRVRMLEPSTGGGRWTQGRGARAEAKQDAGRGPRQRRSSRSGVSSPVPAASSVSVSGPGASAASVSASVPGPAPSSSGSGAAPSATTDAGGARRTR